MTQSPMADQWIFIVYFIYGLAFFVMGIALLLETGRLSDPAQAGALRALGAFGLLHGTHEWLESDMKQAESLGVYIPAWLPWLRLSLLFLSYIALLIFAIQSFRLTTPGGLRKRIIFASIFGLYASLILFSAFITYRFTLPPWVDLLEGLMRYLMAIPAALLATKSMVDQSRQARLEARTPLNIYFLITALGFGIYAMTHLFVHPLNMIPARWLNSDNFMAITGFPIQVIRALAAILISYSLLRAAQLMEEERKTALFSAQQSQLEAMRQQEMLRRDLLTHTVHTQEEERARIARELHDETSQELSAFSLELAALRSMIKGQNSAIAKVDHLQNLSRQISQEIYRLVHDLRPAQLDDLGLVAALRYLIGQYHSNMNIDIALKVSGDVHRLAPMLETVLFRVAQEAITNVIRHAGTREAAVEIMYEEDHIYLTVTDQGQGFNVFEHFAAPRGWGLAGMRERVESVNGEFKLVTAPGKGTKVEVIMPLENNSK